MNKVSKIQQAVALIAEKTNMDNNNIIAEITNWNKTKVYPVSVIDIKIDPSGVTDNADKIGDMVAKIEEAVKDTVANELDLENVSDMKKTVAEIGKWLIETRKIQTTPLGEVAKHYTPHESKFSDFNTDLTKKIDAINEKEYQKSENAIREYFDEVLKENSDVEIEMTLFDSFIQAKRKNEIFTDKGALKKGIKDDIAEQVRLAVEPIRKARELEAKKSLQSKQFENYLARISSEGTNEELNNNIEELVRLKSQVGEIYPDVVEYCLRAIDNKISFAKANIKANDAVQALKAVENVDDTLMQEFAKLESEYQNYDMPKLAYTRQRLREMWHEATLAENQEKIKILGVNITNKITDMERKSVETITVKKEPVEVTSQTIYCVALEDIEVLAGMEIIADSEDEAKKELCKRFEAHLSMVDLIKKGE